MLTSWVDTGFAFCFFAFVGFFGSIAGIGCLIYWLFKHVAIV